VELAASKRPQALIACMFLTRAAALSALAFGSADQKLVTDTLQQAIIGGVQDARAKIASPERLHLLALDPGELRLPEDWGALMHWSKSGQAKIAAALVERLAPIVRWRYEESVLR
jgi:hypothetical protein